MDAIAVAQHQIMHILPPHFNVTTTDCKFNNHPDRLCGNRKSYAILILPTTSNIQWGMFSNHKALPFVKTTQENNSVYAKSIVLLVMRPLIHWNYFIITSLHDFPNYLHLKYYLSTIFIKKVDHVIISAWVHRYVYKLNLPESWMT